MEIYLKRDSPMPLYEQIYRAIKTDILSGALEPGARLPATRRLAADLCISRNTVDLAYQQLAIEGYLYALVGSGFRVEAGVTDHLTHLSQPPLAVLQQHPQSPQIKYDFWFPLIDRAMFPAKAWSKAMQQAEARVNGSAVCTYPDRMGVPALRQALVRYLRDSRGVHCRAEQIVVACGMQFNLELLLKLFPPAEGTVAIEDPCYYGARHVFVANGCRLVPLAVEKDGVSIEALQKSGARLGYVTPSHQFPTGAVLPVRKRLAMLEWAQQNNAYILEDDYDSELRYRSMPVPSLHLLDRSGRVIYAGTFSKSLSPDLRISYFVLPEGLEEQYRKVCGCYTGSVSLTQQYALAELMENGVFERHLNKMRVLCGRRHDAFLDALAQVFGKRVRVLASGAGLHIPVRVAAGKTRRQLIDSAAAAGARVYDMEDCYIAKNAPPDELLLGFGGIAPEQYENALLCLRRAWFD